MTQAVENFVDSARELRCCPMCSRKMLMDFNWDGMIQLMFSEECSGCHVENDWQVQVWNRKQVVVTRAKCHETWSRAEAAKMVRSEEAQNIFKVEVGKLAAILDVGVR